MIAVTAAAAAAFLLLLGLMRLLLGPTLYDRALAAKAVAVRGALAAGAIAVASGQTAWIDAAVAIVFAALVVMTAVSKVFRARTFQAPLAREDA